MAFKSSVKCVIKTVPGIIKILKKGIVVFGDMHYNMFCRCRGVAQVD